MKRNISAVITLIFLAAACYFVAQPFSSARATNARPDDTPKKELPKQVTLAKDSQSDKYGEVAFDHETHSTKNYSVDGKANIACTECHHTDQPASALKPPLKTSERKVALTAEALKAPDAVGVKTCRTCHLQTGDDSKEMPSANLDGKTTPTKINNELAYHRNCNTCHDAAIKTRPDLKGKIPGTNDCAKCHKPIE
ncbi:MAG TPA: cytochrome c3 family protein [Pyrinomonadaceae bacterium]